MSQIEKNTVSAKNQLDEQKYIKFVNPEGKGKRIMFAGNSITLHGVKPEIGWYGEWGMAASCKEKDYVHQVIKAASEKYPDAVYCITQISRWEINYAGDYNKALAFYENARDFDADIIIIRAVENCRWDVYDEELFMKSYKAMIDYLNKGNAKIILTTSFWVSKADNAIKKVGEKNGYPVIYLGDLGDDLKMMAIGQFEHEGVSMHPNDSGMCEIANRILKQL